MIQESKYGLSEIKDEEAIQLTEIAINNNNGDVSEAIQDLKMIDSLLAMKKLHFAVQGSVRKTRKGNHRKGHLLSDALMSVIDARLTNNL